jgi:hypothetical protein
MQLLGPCHHAHQPVSHHTCTDKCSPEDNIMPYICCKTCMKTPLVDGGKCLTLHHILICVHQSLEHDHVGVHMTALHLKGTHRPGQVQWVGIDPGSGASQGGCLITRPPMQIMCATLLGNSNKPPSTGDRTCAQDPVEGSPLLFHVFLTRGATEDSMKCGPETNLRILLALS